MPPRRFTDTEESEIAQMYLHSRRSAAAIAEMYKCNPHTIRHALRRQNVPLDEVWRRENVYNFDTSAFDTIDNELSAYWLGFIYADGHVRQKPPTLFIQLSGTDMMHLEKFREFLKSENPIHNTIDNSKKTTYFKSTLYVTDKKFASRLIELGIINGRSQLQSTLRYLPESLFPHFIRGIFDGDGCAAKRRPELIFFFFYDLMVWIRDTISVQLDTSPQKTISQHQHNIRYISFGGRYQVKRFAGWMYQDATVWLERKRDIIDSYD